MSRISMSRSTLLTLCGWWARSDVDYPAETSSEFAALGNEVHEAIACTINRQPLPRLSKAAAAHHRAWFFGWWRPRQGQGWRAEVAYGLNVVTGEARELTLPAPRQYPDLGAEWLPGTADATRLDGDLVEVVDWKTGGKPPRAKGNGQLYSLAIAAATLHRRPRARVSIVSITTAGCITDSHELDAFEMGQWRERLADAHAYVPHAEQEPGPHCDALYCPARGSCEARQQITDNRMEQSA